MPSLQMERVPSSRQIELPTTQAPWQRPGPAQVVPVGQVIDIVPELVQSVACVASAQAFAADVHAAFVVATQAPLVHFWPEPHCTGISALPVEVQVSAIVSLKHDAALGTHTCTVVTPASLLLFFDEPPQPVSHTAMASSIGVHHSRLLIMWGPSPSLGSSRVENRALCIATRQKS